MAGAVELATAYIALVPSLKGASQKIQQELGSVDTASAGSEMGRKMGGGMAGSIKSLVGPAIALMGSGMFAGFIGDAAKASDATDKFKATMSFAGMDTSAITKAAKAAKDYADQTVYDLPTIQNMTAQLASNGVKDYTGLTKAAGNLNAVAGGNADTFKSVAMVMTQTAGAGKLTTENWNQMADAIPGAAGPLMKSLKEAGAYTGNFRDAMAAGEISSDEFNASLMKLGNDPVAVEAAKSTKTFEGAIGNLTATINSGLMSALDAMKPAITGAISGVANGISVVNKAIGGIFELFKTGNFNGGIGKALGVSEDSKVVGVILTIRNGVLGLRSAFSGDGITSGGFVGVMERIGVAARAVVTGAGPALRGVFSAIGPIFASIASAVGPLIPEFLKLWGAVSPVQTIFKAIQPLLPQLLGVFGQLAAVIGGTLGQALHALLPVFLQLQAVFVRVFSQVLAQVLPVVVRLITMMGQTFTQLIPVIVPIVTRIAQLAATLVSQLAPILMRLISAVMPMVITIFGLVASAIGPLIQIIAGLLIPIIQALMPVVVTVFGVIANVITAAMQIVQGIIQVVTGIITGNWSMVWTGILSILSGVWNLITGLISGAIGIVGSVISAGLGLVGSVFSSVFNGVVGFLGGVWNNIVNGVSGMIGNVIGFFGGLIGKITGAIGNAAGALFGIGRDIIQGLINGIGSMMGAIGQAILSLVPGPIIGVFKDLLGIRSPSRVFHAFGGFIGEGLVNGLVASVPSIRSTTQKMAKEIIAAFDHHAITRGVENTLLSAIGRTNDSLVRLANQRGAVLSRLKNATTAYNDAVKVRNDYAGSIADSARSGVDASQSLNLVNSLSMQISKTKELTTTLASLKKMGVDSTTYKQLADGGLDSIPAAEALLRTGKGGIAHVASLQKQLGGAAKALGSTAAENLYGAGVNAARGLVNGLKSQSAAIGAQMTAIAKSMSSAIKHALGIRSPSTVFHGFGINIVEGLMNGTDSLTDDLNAKMANLVKVPNTPTGISPALLGGNAAAERRAGVTIGTVHVRDEHEMARIITNKQLDAQLVYGF